MQSNASNKPDESAKLSPEQLAYQRRGLPIPSQAQIERGKQELDTTVEAIGKRLKMGTLAGRETP